MPSRITMHRVPALLDSLARAGHIEDRPAVETFVLARQGATELPLYIRLLIGVGAIIASVCFVAFLSETNFIDFGNPRSELIFGLGFIAAAIGLHRLSGTARTIPSSFLLQTSFAAMATGKVLFVTGFDAYFDSSWGVSLAILLVTAATYHVYRMSIDRFLSSFAVLFSVLSNIAWGDAVALPREALFNGYFAVQLACAAVLLTHGRIRCDYVPIGYAFAFSLSVTVLYLAASQTLGVSTDTQAFQPLFVNAVLAGGLIALFAWAAGSIDALNRQPMVLASLGAVLLGVVSAPGVLLAIGLMILGYANHERLLLVLGALLMPAFLCLYYYNLDVSLLNKSMILTGSGVILLAGRFYMSHAVQSHAA